MASEDSYYVLRYQADAVQEATSTNEGIDEDGIEAAFDVSRLSLSLSLSPSLPPSLPLCVPCVMMCPV